MPPDTAPRERDRARMARALARIDRAGPDNDASLDALAAVAAFSPFVPEAETVIELYLPLA